MTLKQWCLDLARDYRAKAERCWSEYCGITSICPLILTAPPDIDFTPLRHAINKECARIERLFIAPTAPYSDVGFTRRAEFLEALAEGLTDA